VTNTNAVHGIVGHKCWLVVHEYWLEHGCASRLLSAPFGLLGIIVPVTCIRPWLLLYLCVYAISDSLPDLLDRYGPFATLVAGVPGDFNAQGQRPSGHQLGPLCAQSVSWCG
jgi:hypothetical protein